MLQVLDAGAVRRWCEDGAAALAGARAEIDGLNVFPVPDGDTGTNLLLTAESVVQAVRAAGDELAPVAAALSRGALMGARGNSGVILSQLLRGLAEVLADGPADGRALARGLARGADLAYAGVAAPVEGTLLTVARAAAQCAAGCDLGEVVAGALAGASAALVRTQDQLPVLRDAGVVDAGGRGWVVLLQALAAVVREEQPVAAAATPAATPAVTGPAAGPAYEVQYLLTEADEPALATLRTTLAGLGDSLVVVGEDGLYNVHVHVDDVGAALEAGVVAGRPSRITVTRFADSPSPSCPRPAARPLVVGGAPAGLGELLRGAGAVALPGAPSVAELVDALVGPAGEAVLLPSPEVSDAHVAAVVEGARLRGTRVEVVRSRSVVQVLAALAVAEPARALDGAAAQLRAAVQSVRTGEVRPAVRAADTSAGPCLPGDALGVLDGRIELVGADVAWVAERLVVRLATGAELVTVVLGTGAPDGLEARLRAAVTGVELVVLDGGQAGPPVLVGAE